MKAMKLTIAKVEKANARKFKGEEREAVKRYVAEWNALQPKAAAKKPAAKKRPASKAASARPVPRTLAERKAVKAAVKKVAAKKAPAKKAPAKKRPARKATEIIVRVDSSGRRSFWLADLSKPIGRRRIKRAEAIALDPALKGK